MKQIKPFATHKPAPVRANRLSAFNDEFICVTCGRLIDARKRGARCKGAKR